MADILDDYFIQLKKNILRGDNLVIYVAPTDSFFGVFSYTDSKDTDYIKAQILDYIAAAKQRKPNIQAGDIKSYSEDGIRAVGVLIGFSSKDTEAIKSLPERCVFAASTADSIGARGRIDDIVKVWPKISCLITSRGEFACKLDMTQEGLALLKSFDKKNIPSELRDICKHWVRNKSDIANFGFEGKNLIVRPIVDIKDERYFEEYSGLIEDIILDGGELLDDRWGNPEFLKERLNGATESVRLSGSTETFKSPLEFTGFASAPKLKKREDKQGQSSLFPLDCDEPETVQNETEEPKKKVKIKYNIKRLEKMGIDKIFFHRLLR